jgi:hypothetical protein
MKFTVGTIALSALLIAGSVSDARAWSRSGSVTTRRGTYTGSASGSCSGGTCSRSASVTGPNGHTVSRTGSISRTGPDRYAYSRTTTGPNGRSVTRSGWFRRW